jgi:hypothetical protein
MAWTIMTHENATAEQQFLAGAYMGAMVGSHAMLAVGTIILASEAALYAGVQCVLDPICAMAIGAGGIGAQQKTGTIWDSIIPKTPARIGSSIPEQFVMETQSGESFMVTSSGTYHMAEYGGNPVTEQAILTSFEAAVDYQVQQGIEYGVRHVVDEWELMFAPGRGGPFDVIFHAVIKH